MAETRYQQQFARNVKEIVREEEGKKVRYIRFRGILKYRADNPDFIEKPEQGADNRTASQKRRYVWKQVGTQLECKKGRSKQQTEKNISDALTAWRDEMEGKSHESKAVKKSVIDYTTEYINLRERVQVNGLKQIEKSTAMDYRKSCARLERGFSELTMGEVTTKYVRTWEREELERGTSVYQVRKCHRLLHLVFEHAYMEEELDANPVARVIPPSAAKKEPNSLTQEGMQLVTARLEESVPEAVIVAAYLGLHAGLRCAEACALRWQDVDFNAGTITVRGSIGVAKGGSYYKGTKTGKVRVIDFDSEHMADMLKARRSFMLQQRDNNISGFDSLYVCGNMDGGFAVPTVITREWTALAKSWGLVGTTGERATFHVLRHSFVTAQLSSGGSLRDVADNAGHSSTQMTADTYAAALREGKKRASTASGEYMRPKGDAPIHKLDRTGTEG